MSRKPATTKRSTSRHRKAKEGEIRVRMYNVGFGDCLLFWIPTSEGERRVLVDCGYHSLGKGKFSDKELVKQIKEDLDGETLNVVVATHRHQDHISGFGEIALWEGVDIEEVWLPFTANPNAVQDEPGLKLWNGLLDRIDSLWDSNGNLKPVAAMALGARTQDERDEAEFMLWNARANAPAIDNLLDGMKRANGKAAKRRFLPENRKHFPSQFTTPVLPGVTVHVLGPPTDPKFRKSREVPSSWGFGGMETDGLGDGNEPPFSREWIIPSSSRQGRMPFQEGTLKAIRRFNDDLLYAAKKAEGFLNGESLVLVLEIGSARLLLPGDAEVGTWTTILENQDALELASTATFLKVGHHGSHNATPVTFIDKHLPLKTTAVISTQQGTGNFRNGIPLKRLLDRMDARSMSVARSDMPPKAGDKIFIPDPDGRWIDCKISC